MSNNKVAVEINLLSNEFILGVKDDRHPVLLYKRFNVPLVISTDDPGISRTSLTEQYVLLAKRYSEVKYADIKQYVFNSIEYYANIDDWTTNRYTAFEGSDGQVNATYASFLCYSLAECKDKCEPDDFENYKCVDQVFHQPYFVENDSIGGPNCEG